MSALTPPRGAGSLRFILLAVCGLLSTLRVVQAQSWVDAKRQGAEMRFLFPNAVSRYELSTQTWLAPVTLPRSGATAFVWDGTNAYVAYGAAIHRYAPNLTGETMVATVNSSVHGLHVDGNLLIAVHSTGNFARLTVFNRTTDVLLSTRETDTNSLYGTSHAPGLNRVFGRMAGTITPTDIISSDYTDAGVLSGAVDSSYHGTHPTATRTWVSPDESRVVDSAGSVYTTHSLFHLGSLNGTVTDVTFNGDVPVVLRGSQLLAFKNTLGETGRKTLAFSTGAEVEVHGTSAFVFRPGTPNPLVETVPLAEVNAPVPNQPKDASGLAYTPGTIFKDRDGLIGLYSPQQQSVFRWSPATQSYVLPLTVPAAPPILAYSAAHHRIYMSDLRDSTKVLQMNAAPGAAITPFVTLPGRCIGIGTAEEFVIASHNVIGVSTRGTRSYSPAGAALGGGSIYAGLWNEWDPVRRRVYHFRDGVSPEDLIYETIAADGRISGNDDSPYHGEVAAAAPIRISPDGSRLVTGSGQIFETGTLTFAGNLLTTVKDITWQGTKPVSLEAYGSTMTRVQPWSAAWARETPALFLKGAPLTIMPLPAQELLAITLDGGKPRFHILADDLLPQFDSVSEAPAIVVHPVHVRADYRGTATLSVGATGSPDLTYQWLKDNVPLPSATGAALVLTDLGSADAGSYKVTVSNSRGSVTSNSAFLSVGPVMTQGFAAGNLLVSSGGRIMEYTTAGVKMRDVTVPVPSPNAPSTREVSDVVTDRLGRAHVLNRGLDPNGAGRWYLSVYDPGRTVWSHVLFPGAFFASAAHQDLSLGGDWIYGATARLNWLTGSVEEVILPVDPGNFELAVGLDGNLYLCDDTGEVDRMSASLSLLNTYQYGSTVDLQGIAADFTGRFYVGDEDSRLGSFSAGGTLVKWFSPAGAWQGFYDVSLSNTGRIAAGSRSGLVALTDTVLVSASTINPGTSSASYTAWVTPAVIPAPAFAAGAAPPAVEDTLFEWTPQISHVDPDAVITLTAPVLPPWLTLTGNTLRGTPLQAHTGSQSLRLRATDGFGQFTERNYTIDVVMVNDTPTGHNDSIFVNEDAPPLLVDLTTLFSDEETAAAALGYQITASTGTVAAAALEGTMLRLTFPANANGGASFNLRATDAGGRTADAVLFVFVNAVNDAPVASAIPPVSIDEDAPPVHLPLAGFFSDVDNAVPLYITVSVAPAPAIFRSATMYGADELVLQLVPNASGVTSLTVRATDTLGLFAETTWQISVLPVPDPPAVPAFAPPATLGPAQESWQMDLSSVFTDPDPGERLTFTIEENSNPALFASIAVTGHGLMDATIAPYRWGTAWLRVKATGTDGLSSETWLELTVPAPPPPSLTVAPAFTLNRQTGLLELTATVKNTGPRALGGYEILLGALPAGVEVYNASSRSDGLWTVHSEVVLPSGAESTVVLEFYSPARVSPALMPFIAARPIMPAGALPADGAGFTVDRIVRLTDGVLLEFPSVIGTSYEVQWSDDDVSWKASLPHIRAAGTRVQWIDRGAPRTDKSPLLVPKRLYRVKKLEPATPQ